MPARLGEHHWAPRPRDRQSDSSSSLGTHYMIVPGWRPFQVTWGTGQRRLEAKGLNGDGEDSEGPTRASLLRRAGALVLWPSRPSSVGVPRALTFPWLSMPTRAREVQDSCMALKCTAGPVVRGRLMAGSSAERGAAEL